MPALARKEKRVQVAFVAAGSVFRFHAGKRCFTKARLKSGEYLYDLDSETAETGRGRLFKLDGNDANAVKSNDPFYVLLSAREAQAYYRLGLERRLIAEGTFDRRATEETILSSGPIRWMDDRPKGYYRGGSQHEVEIRGQVYDDRDIPPDSFRRVVMIDVTRESTTSVIGKTPAYDRRMKYYFELAQPRTFSPRNFLTTNGRTIIEEISVEVAIRLLRSEDIREAYRVFRLCYGTLMPGDGGRIVRVFAECGISLPAEHLVEGGFAPAEDSIPKGRVDKLAARGASERYFLVRVYKEPGAKSAGEQGEASSGDRLAEWCAATRNEIYIKFREDGLVILS